MPSCLTKSFAAFLCQHASPQINRQPPALPQPATAANPTRATPRTERSATKLPMSTARRRRKPPARVHGRPRSSAKRHAAQKPKSARRESAAHPTIVPTRRTGRRSSRIHPLHAVLTVVLIAFLAPLLAHAHSDESLQQFEIGKQAVAAKDFATALDAFEAAAAAGMTGPEVPFSTAACASRLGRWSRAASAFREVARTPEMAPLAHYNLGLVALGDGKRDEAARWFAQAERETTDEALRSL